MNNKNNILIGIIAVLGLLVVGMGSYIIYDKINYKDINENNAVNNENNGVNDITNVDCNTNNDNTDTDVNLNVTLYSSDVENALKIVKDVTKKYLDYKYSLSIYCGEYDRDDYLTTGSNETRDWRQYWASKQFKSLLELKEYYKSIMVDELIPKYIYDAVVDGVSFIEKDGKLYCQLSGKGCGELYNEDDSYYIIDSISDDKIVVSAVIVTDRCGGIKTQHRGNITLVKENNENWLMFEYDVDVVNSIFYGE